LLDFIEGELAAEEATRVVIRVGSERGALGYTLRVPLGTAERLNRQGDLVRILVTTCTVDELPRLFGFATEMERELFLLLRKVSGVGPKLALSLLSADSPPELLAAIGRGDAAWLKRIKGVGAKTADRICLEVRERAMSLLAVSGAKTTQTSADPAAADAILALVALGFSEAEASDRVGKASRKAEAASTEELVKAALRS